MVKDIKLYAYIALEKGEMKMRKKTPKVLNTEKK